MGPKCYYCSSSISYVGPLLLVFSNIKYLSYLKEKWCAKIQYNSFHQSMDWIFMVLALDMTLYVPRELSELLNHFERDLIGQWHRVRYCKRTHSEDQSY